MSDLVQRRRFYAEELEAVCALQTPGLVDALADVPRERFLPAGPWDVLSVGDYTPAMVPAARRTADADPRHVYHNIGIAIDGSRRLFNGQPGTLASWIDALALTPGARVLHVGAGTGYYTAIMAHIIGPTGRLVAIEVDEALAGTARRNLASMPWVDVRRGDATTILPEPFDAILINAGVTHPREAWLDALPIGGRLLLPLTVEMQATIGKGFMMRVSRESESAFSVKPVGLVAIYSAINVRDAAINAALGEAMRKTPWPPVRQLRRDVHDTSASCWLHGDRWCFSGA